MESIKEKAYVKYNELLLKNDESYTKTKTYLDGLLKIPFGIYKKEPILNIMNDIKNDMNFFEEKTRSNLQIYNELSILLTLPYFEYDEKLLFHLVNAAAESKAFLILSSQNKAQFELKDLSSRIKNIFALEIKNPSQEAIKMLLINAFSRKQLKVSKGVIDFIASHSERTFEAVVVSVKLVEFYTAEVGKNITIKEMKKILY